MTTTKEVVHFWDKAKIPTRKEYHSITKMKQLQVSWQRLKKNSSRRSYTQQGREQKFIDDLGDLFDIAHSDALSIIIVPEDREFLEAQRENGRRGYMGSVDTKLA